MTEELYLQVFIDTLLRIKNKKHLREFLEGILTPQELAEIPMRLQIVKMLKEGVAQQKIAKELKVGVATVTRGSKELQKGRFNDL